MLGLGATLVTGGFISILSYVKDGLKTYFNLTDNSPELLLDGGTEFSSSGSDYISIADPDNDLDIAGDLTITAWIKPTSTGHSFFIDKSASSSTRNYTLYKNSSHQLRFDTEDGNLTGSTLTLGIWTHVAVTCDSGVSNGTKLYVNGYNASSDTGTRTVTSNTNTLHFGRRYDDTNYQYGGKMSSVGIWNRVLSASEIQSIQWKGQYSELSSTELTSLRGWWDLQGDVEDKSGNGNDGTNSSSTLTSNSYTGESPFKPRIKDIATPSSTDPLNFGHAFSGRGVNFNGTSDYIVVPDDTTLDFGTGDFTISFWAFSDDWTQTEKGLIGLAHSNEDPTTAGIFIRTTSADKVETYISASGWGETKLESTSALANGTWNYIVLVRDSGTAKLYINGNLDDEQDNTADVPAYDVTIGRTYEDSSDNYFTGKISSVKIFNDAITEAQIQESYINPEQILATGVSSSNLKLDLPMQEGSGSHVYDGSGNQNHGTITGATWSTGLNGGLPQIGLVRSNTPMIFDGVNDTVIMDNEITDFPFSVSSHFKTGSSFATGNIFSFNDADNALKVLLQD